MKRRTSKEWPNWKMGWRWGSAYEARRVRGVWIQFARDTFPHDHIKSVTTLISLTKKCSPYLLSSLQNTKASGEFDIREEEEERDCVFGREKRECFCN
ncbi:unnamed protein product [Dovyalis caffra]|uniref:Uncharacterized protein n=1 Tax=Dovyalis caffra TaxID=77055 RepID=A0AAV1SVH3_9ROSI|nr:unnamed protein product [Dovyalis caffra]